MPASKSARFFCNESSQELTIKGKFNTKNSKPNHIPDEIVSLFDKYPDIDEIAMSGCESGMVWSRVL